MVPVDAAILVSRPHLAEYFHPCDQYRLPARGWPFYAWEGVGSCGGTCTHVWSYEQAMGRLFPELDISLRERVDYNPTVGFNPTLGTIGNRAEIGMNPAADGQAGTILRTYRDYLVSPDDAFLRRN